jgi:S1-C subfamily serine protease
MENQTPKINKTIALSIILLFLIGISQFSFADASVGDALKGFFAPIFRSNNSATAVATSTATSTQVTLYQPVIDYEKAVVAAVKKASPAVVSITISKNVPTIEQCPGASPFSDLPPEFQQLFGNDFNYTVPCQKGSQLQEVGGGSGFIIQNDGLVLTNKHVVSDASASYTVFTNDGKKYSATVLARDPVQDLAVLKIDATGLPTVILGDSNTLELGQTAIAIGNALGEYRNTVSVGVVSGLSRTVTAQGGGMTEKIQNVIQTDAAINPGNSGGPLLNLNGEVVGMNTAIVSGAQNIGFAIPINSAKGSINSIKTSGKIITPYLGVRYVMITGALGQQEKLPIDHGAIIRSSGQSPAVIPGSPSEKAGIKSGDIVLQVDGVRVDDNNGLIDLIAQHGVGDTVNLRVYRDGKEIDVPIKLTERPAM